ncbi:MAG: 5-oxoprolinase subunit PxpB [Xanthomonadales bacterium]|nr:5-oxoprolinase subunit PxpB [Xanthomonadales bacterium]
MSSAFNVETLGEDALLLRFGHAIDPQTNRRVHACAAALARQRPPWLLDIVPAFSTLALAIDVEAFNDSSEPLADARCWLESLDPGRPGADIDEDARRHEIPLHYGGEHGPDLEALARHAGLSVAQVIALHTAVEYRVGMLGFAPGFPYLIGMDERLSMPRHATPRTRVQAGSVGIAGAQTGIYPGTGPGGWQIIGRTDAILFDATQERPALLEPGDRVRFIDIDARRESSS